MVTLELLLTALLRLLIAPPEALFWKNVQSFTTTLAWAFGKPSELFA